MKGFLTGRGAHARRTGLGGATAVLRRPTAVLLALLMMLSVVVVIGATTATEAEAYGECIVTVERPEDPDPNIAEMNGLTDVFIKAHGNVGMISNGVGLLGTSPHINPQEIDMAHVDITSDGPDTTYTKIPPNADIERAFLYWGGDFGSTWLGGGELPLRTDAPEGCDKMVFDGVLLSSDPADAGTHPVDYVGYQQQDNCNHRRLYRSEVTDIVKDTPPYDRVYTVKTTVAPNHNLLTRGFRVWWGATLVIVYTHPSITESEICISDGCNILYPDESLTYTADDIEKIDPTFPSAYKGVVTSEGGAPDVMTYDFQSLNGDGDPNAPGYHQDEVSEDSDGDSWDDRFFEINDHVAADTEAYTVDLWNNDTDDPDHVGAHCDLYVDWFWFGAMIDFQMVKNSQLAVDNDGNGFVSPGDTLKYTISYRNYGETPTGDGVTIIDDYEEGSFDSVHGISQEPPDVISSVDDGDKITWQLTDLPGRSSEQPDPEWREQSYFVTLKGPGYFEEDDEIYNSATLVDNQTSYLVMSDHTEKVYSPSMKITKSGPISVAVGEDIDYTIKVTNTSDVTLNNVNVVDDLLGIDETIRSLAPGESEELSGSYGPVTDDDMPTVHNEASASCEEIPHGITDEHDVDVKRATPPPPDQKVLGSKGWFLAEGSTGGGFDTWILLQNPQNEEANVEVTFMTREGDLAPMDVPIGARSRATLRINDYVPDDFHVSTKVKSDVPIIADRSMYWHKQGGSMEPYEMMSGHANIGTTLESLSAERSLQSRNVAYFPEGATAGGFDTWILLCNPNEQEATVAVAFTTSKGIEAQSTIVVPPLSRRTVHLDEHVPDSFEVATEITCNIPIVAERSLYWDENTRDLQPYETGGGHSNSGSFYPAGEWFLAEGSTGEGFETYILIQNPQDESAEVTATFMNAQGIVAEESLNMGPHSRGTLRVSDYAPDDFHISTKVVGTQDIVAERSMYWDKRAVTETYAMRDGHSAVGVSSLGSTWMVAEGSTGIGFDTWILLSNPGDTEAAATVTFMTYEGPSTPFDVAIPPASRSTIRISDHVPDDFHVSTLVESNATIAVERSMYWDRREWAGIQPYEMMGGHSSLGIDP